MAIKSVLEIHDGRSGDDSLQSGKGTRKHTRTFRVVTTSQYDGSYEVLAACPSLGSRHSRDPYAYCISRKASNESFSKFVWKATLEYSTLTERSENPLNDPAVIEWSTDTQLEPFEYDKNGHAILNSAGDVFEDRVKDEVSLWTVTITKNLSYVPSWINTYRDAVNSDSCFIDGVSISAGMAKIKSIKISKWQTRNDIRYRELQLTIKIKSSWEKRVLDQGLRCKFDWMGTTGLEPCLDAKGIKATKPMLLDGSGYQLPVPLSSPSAAVFLTFDLRNQQPFSFLPLN